MTDCLICLVWRRAPGGTGKSAMSHFLTRRESSLDHLDHPATPSRCRPDGHGQDRRRTTHGIALDSYVRVASGIVRHTLASQQPGIPPLCRHGALSIRRYAIPARCGGVGLQRIASVPSVSGDTGFWLVSCRAVYARH